MAEIRKSIEVNAPVERVYGYWSNLTNLPNILNHVENVEVRGTTTSHWTVSVGGKTMEWDATQTLQPNQEVSWSAQGDVTNDGTVRFTPIDGNRTRIEVTIRHEPRGAIEKAGTSMGFDDRAVQTDLENFKQKIESGSL